MNNDVSKDEITRARKERAKQKSIRKVKESLLILSVFVLVYLFLANFSVSLTYDISDAIQYAFTFGSFPSQLPSGSFISAAVGKKSVAVVGDTYFATYKAGGAELYSENHGISNPCLAASGNRFLIYSCGGKAYKIYNRTHLIDTIVTDYSIISGDVSYKGKTVILTSGDEYTCELLVLNRDGSSRFTWKGSRGFPLAVFASDSSDTAAVVCLETNSGKFTSIITVIDLNKNCENCTFEMEGIAVKVLIAGDNVIAVFEDCVRFIDESGNVYAQYDFTNEPLLDIAPYGNRNFCIALGDNNKSSINKLVILNSKGEIISELKIGIPINGLYINGDRLSVLSGTTVYSYTSSGVYRGYYESQAGTLFVVDIGGPIGISTTEIRKLVLQKEKN